VRRNDEEQAMSDRIPEDDRPEEMDDVAAGDAEVADEGPMSPPVPPTSDEYVDLEIARVNPPA
jgi:hypothetical protein